MKIRFVDLSRQNKVIKTKLMSSIENVVVNADFTMGPRLINFEKNLANFCGKKYAIGVNSGTDALFLSLMAYGIKEGDEVIVPVNSYFSTAMVVSNLNAKPVFVDIDENFFTMDIKKIERAITSKTKAIIPVHIFGQPAQMDEILSIAKKNKLVVIEDACQAHGAMYKNRMIPYGETGAFSFFPGKNLGAFGDAGAVVTDNKKIAEKIRLLRNDGSDIKYVHTTLGIKSRMDALQAEILNIKLPFLIGWNNSRRSHAKLYTNLLSDLNQVKTPRLNSDMFHVFHLYVIECKNRNKLKSFLEKNGVETIIHYPIPIHLQKPYKNSGYKIGDFPIAEKKAKTILSLPIFPEITNYEVTYVCNLIKDFYKSNN